MGWFTRAVEAAKKNDPAARSTLEVVLTYPASTHCFGTESLTTYMSIDFI